MSAIKEPPKKSQTLERLTRKITELGKREKEMWVMPSGPDWEGNIPTPERWTFQGFEKNGPLVFDRLARDIAIVLGWGQFSEEDARNRLLDKVRDYLVDHQHKHKYIKVYPGSVCTGKRGKPPFQFIPTESVEIYRVCEAVTDYLLHLEQPLTPRFLELDITLKPPTPETSPTNDSERSNSEIKRDRRVEERREVTFEFLKRSHLKVESARDASRVLRNKVQLHVLYGLFNEKGIVMISSPAYQNVTWYRLKTNRDLQKIYDKKIVDYLVKDMQRNWKRLWDESHQVPQVP